MMETIKKSNKFFPLNAFSVKLFFMVAVALVLASGLVRAETVGSKVPLCEITRGLTIGATGEDVRCLQRYLNWAGHMVALSGAGSPGNETEYFGPLTQKAVIQWQNANATQVLTPLGLTSATGYWGNSSFGRYVQLVRKALGL